MVAEPAFMLPRDRCRSSRTWRQQYSSCNWRCLNVSDARCTPRSNIQSHKPINVFLFVVFFFVFLPHDVVKRGICCERVCPSVCLSACLSHSWGTLEWFKVITSIYWHSCDLKAEQLDKTRKGLKTCKQHNKPTKWREGSSPLAVTECNLVMIQGVINKGAIFLVRETGRGNPVAVLSRDKTDVSRGGGNKW